MNMMNANADQLNSHSSIHCSFVPIVLRCVVLRMYECVIGRVEHVFLDIPFAIILLLCCIIQNSFKG